MKGREFVFDYVHLFHYKCRKINPNQIAIKRFNKKDNKCFQYAVTVELNHKERGNFLKE